MQTQVCLGERNYHYQRKRKLSGFSESTQSTDDQNNFEKQQIEKKSKKYVQKKQQKYKTELCKNFSETGFCPYRRKCKFAHGMEQLQEVKKEQGKYYRTKKCNSFWKDGVCSYGQRCQFSHHRVEKETIQLLGSWHVAIDNATNQSGFSGSRLLRLLDLQ